MRNRVNSQHVMTYESLLNDLWQSTLARLGGNAAVEACAREKGAFARARSVASAADLLRLILAYCMGRHGVEVDERLGRLRGPRGPFERRFAEALAQMRPLDGASGELTARQRRAACGARTAHPACRRDNGL